MYIPADQSSCLACKGDSQKKLIAFIRRPMEQFPLKFNRFRNKGQKVFLEYFRDRLWFISEFGVVENPYILIQDCL